MVARCAANIASIRNLYTQKIYGSTMTAGSFMRKSNRMSYIFSLLTEALHSEAENLVYRAISLMNSVNSVDRNGSFPVETSLNVAQENIEKLVPVVDSYIIDIKDINNAIYQKYTGKDNEKVLHNLQYLIDHGKNEQIIVRTPVIPAYNTENDVDYSIRLLKEMGITQFDRFTYKTPNNCQP